MKPLLIALLVLTAVPAYAQRLPDTVVPAHYDLTVEPDLAKATFSGREAIDVTLKTPSKAIVLNAAEITFGDVQIVAGGKTQPAAVTLDARQGSGDVHRPGRAFPPARHGFRSPIRAS